MLMSNIRAKWGTLITATCAASSVLPEFLAALIANETGGNPDAQRFEKNDLAAIWQVLLGRKTNFGSIGRSQLLAYLETLDSSKTGVGTTDLPAGSGAVLWGIDGLATSWGLTQIMGFQILDRAFPFQKLASLQDPEKSMIGTLILLTEFAHRFQLDVRSDFPALFACWNTGGPDPQKTFDPNYVPNGLARMEQYKNLAAPAILTAGTPADEEIHS